MVKTSNQKNMSFVEDSGGESDVEFNDTNSECGDRHGDTGDEDDADIYKTEEEVPVKLSKLEDPDKMEYIRKALQMPSAEEMYNWWISELELEKENKSNFIALNTIKKWVSFYLIRKHKRLAAQYQEYRVKELVAWRKTFTSNKRGILRLDHPVQSFEIQYAEMTAIKNKEEKRLADIKEKERMEKVIADSKVAAAKASIRFKTAGKMRAFKNQGMNRNTEWHAVKGSLAVKPIARLNTQEGKGKRTMRKAKQIKEQEEAKKQADRIAADIAQVKPIVHLEPALIQSEQELEAKRLQKELEEAEAKAEAEMLDRYNRLIVEMIEKKEKEEKDAIEVVKQLAEDKKADDEFADLMYKSDKNIKKLGLKGKAKTDKTKTKKNEVTSLLQFNSIIDDARKNNNEKYSRRCDAFQVLGDKNKIGTQLKFTKLCNSVTTGKKCYHKNCHFAHDISQLTRKDCRFGDGCNFVHHQGNGIYINKIFGRTGKTCDCMHPGEEDKGFSSRMGLKYKPPTAPLTTPPITQTLITPTLTQPIIPPIRASTSLPLWSEIVLKSNTKLVKCLSMSGTNVLEKGFNWVKGIVKKKTRASRWDLKNPHILEIENNKKVMELKINKVIDAVEKINKKVMELKNKEMARTLTQSKQKTVVFRVPREKAEMALLSAIRSGIKDFRIEYSN